MKPLAKKDLDTFSKRFCDFVDAQIRSIEVITPTSMLVSIATQDEALGFDWVVLEFEFSGVVDAQLIENDKLSFVDMSDGASFLYEDEKFAFCIGQYKSLSNLKNSKIFIISSNLKYEQKPYS